MLAFNEDTWYCTPDPLGELPQAGPLGGASREEITLSSVDELTAFARRVNVGDAAARTAVVILTADIDLGNRAWVPIGIDEAHSFRGSFDGRGHRIKNFRVIGKDLAYCGLFGVLEGGVYNLTVDCAVSGDGVIGSLAA